ncbi:MAG: M20/M25/M40 family metallo-hydrolase [Vicinamibacterales bacterium]
MPALADTGLDLVALTRTLVDIDSTTGRERDTALWLSRYLRQLGFVVDEQPVDDLRFNLVATVDPAAPPAVVLSTHMDCVPPFFPSRVENGRIYGRGACDAKGILAAQIAAVDRLRREGESRVGLLFVVGEERGSDGAKRANLVPGGSRYLVDGEPTEGRLGVATRGILRVRLRANGRAAHSSFPELGESAIDKLIDALTLLRGIELPADPLLGRTHFTIGLIAGGVAPNVVPPSAEAEVMFRTVSAAAEVEACLRPLDRLVLVQHILEVPPVRMATVSGFDTAVFPFATDIPFLAAWGEPLLFGPGSIHVAHTAHEFIDIGEQASAVDAYVRIARALLAGQAVPTLGAGTGESS